MKLLNVELNKIYKVVDIHLKDNKLKLRLEELGIYKNAEIKLIKFSPLKQTVLIELMNTTFAIKSEVAKTIEVI